MYQRMTNNHSICKEITPRNIYSKPSEFGLGPWSKAVSILAYILHTYQEKLPLAASDPGPGALRNMSAEGNSVYAMFRDASFLCCLF